MAGEPKIKVPETISEEKWDGLRKAAARQEARDGGMFTPQAAARRETHDEQFRQRGWN